MGAFLFGIILSIPQRGFIMEMFHFLNEGVFTNIMKKMMNVSELSLLKQVVYCNNLDYFFNFIKHMIHL